MRSAAWRRGGGALHGRGGADHRQGAAASGRRSTGSRRPAAGSRSPAGAAASGRAITGRAWAASGRAITGRAWQHRGGRSPAWRGQHRGGRSPGRAWQQQAGDPLAGRGSSRQPITGRAWQQQAADHRQGVAASGRAIPLAGRASCWQQIHRQQGGQGLKAAKSSHAKDESPTGILSTHIRVAAEKNFFTPRRGVIWAEKRPFPARGRKPCYDFCVGRESPPAKQKLHSADHGAERISP